MAIYELWDLRSGNLVGAYSSEASALAVVREAIQRYGRAYVEWLALARDEDDETTPLAEGLELAERAAKAVPGDPTRV